MGSKSGYGAIGSQSKEITFHNNLYGIPLILDSPENRSGGIGSGDLRRSPKDEMGGSKNRWVIILSG